MVDVSGSMKGLRLTIAKQTVSSILDTLGDDDFFNIITVSVSALCFLRTLSHLRRCNVMCRVSEQSMKVGYTHVLFKESGRLEDLLGTENAVKCVASSRSANSLSCLLRGCWRIDLSKMSHELLEFLTR